MGVTGGLKSVALMSVTKSDRDNPSSDASLSMSETSKFSTSVAL